MLPALLVHGKVHAVLQDCTRAASGVPWNRCPPSVCRLTVRPLTPRGGNVPSARGYHSLVALDNDLVLFGGKDGATLSSQSLAVFDCSKRKWSFPGAVPLQRTTRGCGLLSCAVQSVATAVAAANPHHNSHDCERMCNVMQSIASISLQRYRARVLAPAAAIAQWHGEKTQCCCLAATAVALSVSMICTRCATRPVATHGRRTCSQSSAHDLSVSYGRQQWGDTVCACGPLCIGSIPWGPQPKLCDSSAATGQAR